MTLAEFVEEVVALKLKWSLHDQRPFNPRLRCANHDCPIEALARARLPSVGSPWRHAHRLGLSPDDATRIIDAADNFYMTNSNPLRALLSHD